MQNRTRISLPAVIAVAVAMLLAMGGGASAQEAPPEAAAPAPTGELPISVLSVYTDDAFDQADALTKALRISVRDAEGWALDDTEHSLEVIALALKCDLPPDARCQTRIADEIKADRVVWATLKLQGNSVSGSLNLWTRGQGTVSTPLSYSSNLTEAADSALQGVARDALFELTGGPPSGKLQVRVGNLSGQVFVDGQAKGALVDGQGLFTLPAGEHEVVVKTPGYADLRSTIVISPNQTERLALTPEPLEPESSTDWAKVGGFVGVGMGLAFGAVGVVSTLQVNDARTDDRFEAYRKQFPNSDDVCQNAENGEFPSPETQQADAYGPNDVVDLCNRAATFEIMQAIFYPLAGVSGGIGLYLLATADWGDGEGQAEVGGRWTVGPQFGPSGGRVTASYTW